MTGLRSGLLLVWLATSLWQPATALAAVDTRGSAVDAHARAIEAIGTRPAAQALRELEARHFAEGLLDEGARKALRASIEALRPVIAGAGMIQFDERDGRFVLAFRGSRNADVEFVVDERPPHRIRQFRIVDKPAIAPAPAPEALSWDDLPARLAQAERDGFSGYVLALRGGREVLARGFGQAGPATPSAPSADTVFDIGSMPIDFTRAVILALAQQGRLSMDDALGRHFDGVPEDKQGITLAQLMDGSSGLANFHFRDGDADKDLAWIDRDTAVRRIFGQALLFEPGQGRSHSHSAFGLLAALIEKLTGQPYGVVLRELIFEPAGMQRTGFYGETLGLPESAFAVGAGKPATVPNIPPRWGPASWLVIGSGGMVSSVADMRRAHTYLASGRLLTGDALQRYLAARLGIGGSDRGFFFLRAIGTDGDALFVASNAQAGPQQHDGLVRALIGLVLPGRIDRTEATPTAPPNPPPAAPPNPPPAAPPNPPPAAPPNASRR